VRPRYISGPRLSLKVMSDNRAAEFDALVTPHLPTLHRVAYRLVRNTPDAHDLVQDVCIAACENLATLKGVEYPVRWLLRVLHNRFINIAERRKRAPFVQIGDSPGAAQIPSSEPGPEALLQMDDAERMLEYAFLQLDDTQRTLLSLRAEGYGLTEIENITGIGKEVLRARLHRARRSLAQHLEQQQGIAPSATLSPRSGT
jgi:RNA polymerase sigma-70 factor, ECF subfamily